MPSVTRLRCAYCRKPFDKETREVKRRKKHGQVRFFCTQSCQISLNNQESPRGSTEHLQAGNRADALSPFRWFALRARQRADKAEAVVDPQYLKGLWESQNGRCPLTGWCLELPRNSMGWEKGAAPKSASLDRIDQSRGYVQGNVRFVALIANLARWMWTDEQLIRFCESVTEHNRV
jgi:hypothetical protein